MFAFRERYPYCKPISQRFSLSATISFLTSRSNPWCLLPCLLAPTLPPTTVVPSTTPSDECDDDQTSCHSGTGDDYDETGANIAFMRLRPTFPSPLFPFPPLCLHSVCSLQFFVLQLTCHLTRKHACMHAYTFVLALIQF